MLAASDRENNRAVRIFVCKTMTGYAEITQEQVPSLSSVPLTLCFRSCITVKVKAEVIYSLILVSFGEIKH